MQLSPAEFLLLEENHCHKISKLEKKDWAILLCLLEANPGKGVCHFSDSMKIFIAKYSLKKVSIYNFLLVEHSRKYLIIDIFCKWRNKLETGFSVSAQKWCFFSGVTCFKLILRISFVQWCRGDWKQLLSQLNEHKISFAHKKHIYI